VRLSTTVPAPAALRVCKDGTPNANSCLYGRVRRLSQLIKCEKVILYMQQEEAGASLRAVGAQGAGKAGPMEWSVPNRPRANQAVCRYRSPALHEPRRSLQNSMKLERLTLT
jgi:hypothetical protein